MESGSGNMKRLLTVLAATCVAARPDGGGGGYGGGGFGGSGGSSSSSGGGFAPVPSGSYGAPTGQRCPSGQIQRNDGSCAQPMITRNLYLYNAPKHEPRYGPPPKMPDPKIHYNFVFLKTPEQIAGLDPIVAPPPKQKTLVYLLSKRPDLQEQKVIEFPAKPTKPEVFFVAYGDGENPDLPGGVDLRTALSQATPQDGTVVGDYSGGSTGGSTGGSGGGYSAPGGSSGGSSVSGGGGSIGGGYSSPSGGGGGGGSGGSVGTGYVSPGSGSSVGSGGGGISSGYSGGSGGSTGGSTGYSSSRFGSSGGSRFGGSSGGGGFGGGYSGLQRRISRSTAYAS